MNGHKMGMSEDDYALKIEGALGEFISVNRMICGKLKVSVTDPSSKLTRPRKALQANYWQVTAPLNYHLRNINSVNCN